MFISVFCVIYYIEFNSNTWIKFPIIITSMELSNGNQLCATWTGFNGEQMVLNGRSRISSNDRCALHKRWKKCFKEVLQMVECSCYCCRCDQKPVCSSITSDTLLLVLSACTHPILLLFMPTGEFKSLKHKAITKWIQAICFSILITHQICTITWETSNISVKLFSVFIEDHLMGRCFE